MRDPSGLRVIEALCPQVSRYAMVTNSETKVEPLPYDSEIERMYKQAHEGTARPSELLLTADVTLPSGQVLIAGAYVLNQETDTCAWYKRHSPEYEAVVRRMRAIGMPVEE